MSAKLGRMSGMKAAYQKPSMPNFRTRFNDHLRCLHSVKRPATALRAKGDDDDDTVKREDTVLDLDSDHDDSTTYELKDLGQQYREDAKNGKPELKKNIAYVDAVMETDYQDDIAKNLKKEDISEMRMLDPSKKIDDTLKLGTGDDELVDNLVKSAKMGLGGFGNFIPD